MATYCTHLIIIQCIVRAITDDSPIRDVINHLYLCPPSDHKKALMIKVTPGNVLTVHGEHETINITGTAWKTRWDNCI